jgi:hypothetical protein
VFRSASDEPPITANSIEQQSINGSAGEAQDAEPTEPLAELGVAPGNADSNSLATPAGTGQ